MISIGRSRLSNENSTISVSGRLSSACSTKDAFASSYSRKSEFSCKFATTLATEALIEQIKVRNDVEKVSFNTWVDQTNCGAETCNNGNIKACCGNSTDAVRKVSRYIDMESQNVV